MGVNGEIKGLFSQELNRVCPEFLDPSVSPSPTQVSPEGAGPGPLSPPPPPGRRRGGVTQTGGSGGTLSHNPGHLAPRPLPISASGNRGAGRGGRGATNMGGGEGILEASPPPHPQPGRKLAGTRTARKCGLGRATFP